MNITLQLPDDLGLDAQHRAEVESKSMTSWLIDLLRRELRHPALSDLTLVEMLGDPATCAEEFVVPDRKVESETPIRFP